MLGRDGDNYQRQNRASVPVLVTLNSGAVLRGTMFIPRTRSFAEELNRGEQFIEFEPADGSRMFLSRSAIGSVRETEIPRADSLAKKLGTLDHYDAHQVLGVTKDTPISEVRAAYLGLAKMYHPDRFARLDLPPEVLEYLGAVATRVNIAYAELRDSFVLRHGAKADVEADAASPESAA